ncbi:MAG: hypothetical protein KA109_18455 [Saprospiraceae bacterium]|jgi:hypothetical protein|nr:hypothetical protein [Saprospiraceae bacterium]MBK6478044.1 hypothetical protein [Saprospiraceae bacterium]MBK6817800.1 hypothetical protein [Saprospiraceae bacterium]MBK7373178.1 hypothetical protein [Saprospiraceae bacterium]MBK7436836.1 hypothetical protein [Saprospiraceae bacterium]
MKIILSCCTLLLVVLLQFSCNPSCEPLVGLEVMPATGVSGTEVLLRATPLESLIDQDLEIRFGSKPVIEKRFHPQLGLVITIPEGVSGNTDLVVSTPDCQERLNFNAVTEAFFETNKSFIPPAVPQLFIPIAPLPPFPPSLENAWLHPIKTDYCIWFKFLKDPAGKCTTSIDPTQSFEQSTCNGSNTALLYNKNPIFGVLDPAKNLVHFWIDRSKSPGGNLGTEEFIGSFININDTPYKTWELIACTPAIGWKRQRNHMIVATSQTTHRQLIIYQQAFNDPNFGIDCK